MSNDWESLLINVEKPGRYVGGEFGSLKPLSIEEKQKKLLIAISYPDLYEIGMSNLAIRLLQNLFNSLDGVRCERVFAPARDFESALLANSTSLFTLESRIPLSECDIICFSVGYELTLTNLLTILHTGGIPVKSKDRKESDPLVFAGGPGTTNPLPLADFVDAVYVGEGESGYQELLKSIIDHKKSGSLRSQFLDVLSRFDFLWTPDNQRKAKRAWDPHFGKSPLTGTLLPIPSLKTVQDHGVTEIMRGCPHGCRFCHATYYYRPYRIKDTEAVLAEIDRLVFECGYREITLSSLSSGDYPGIQELLHYLNAHYAAWHVSFSLPSLKVNSFTLPLLEELSQERKSGLTFAVESALPWEQKRNNKLVDRDHIIQVLHEAKARGWKKAKFYFMVGLPGSSPDEESQGIIDYVKAVFKETGIYCHVNVGTFIPKPHTPFDTAQQISEADGLYRIQKIRKELRGIAKVGYHSPFLSYLEGIFSRGDRITGELLYRAWEKGARFDAWDDQIDWDLWREVIGEMNDGSPLTGDSWQSVSLGAGRVYLDKQAQAATVQELTASCQVDCAQPCGACRGDQQIYGGVCGLPSGDNPSDSTLRRVKLLIQWSKKGRAVFFSHLDVSKVFERTFLRCRFQQIFTEGKSPKPKIEIAQPLSLGVSSEGEILSTYLLLPEELDTREIQNTINANLPEGFSVSRIEMIPEYFLEQKDKKLPSLMALYLGARYEWILPTELKKTYLPLLRQWEEERGVTLIVKEDGTRLILERNSLTQPGLKGGLLKVLREILGPHFEIKSILYLNRLELIASAGQSYFSYFLD